MTPIRVDFTGAIQSVEIDETQDIEKGVIEVQDNNNSPPPENGYPELPDDRSHGEEKSRGSGDTDLDTSSNTSGHDRHIPLENTVAASDNAEVHVITDIDAYNGSTLGEKIDAMIASHPVVMINRTWCLFSVDAIDFLVQQLNVPVHSVEVDVHPQGKEILKYVTDKCSYHTTPLIFIRGEFLGGFSEVNALYAQGKLQDDYLIGLSQADRCEAFIANSDYEMSTYFWFPHKVDGNVVRLTGVLTFIASALCAILVHWEQFFWARYVAYAIAVDFVLRLLGGAKFSVFGRFAMLLALPLDPIPRMGRPKQFATCCGICFSGLGSLFFLLPFPYHDMVSSLVSSEGLPVVESDAARS
ncbi:unnamed protein product [Cylindrotheca closterium]|uniref:Glutaredoxin domain-containing protein n=1 Tax=Cylindrotheca closterium TaxID=2856 RepID=A0AAD2FSS0_9STRA|nr:unnamed protein product [Cylindrotheca closterium]